MKEEKPWTDRQVGLAGGRSQTHLHSLLNPISIPIVNQIVYHQTQ